MHVLVTTKLKEETIYDAQIKTAAHVRQQYTMFNILWLFLTR